MPFINCGLAHMVQVRRGGEVILFERSEVNRAGGGGGLGWGGVEGWEMISS